MAENKIKITISIDVEDHEYAKQVAEYLAKNKTTGKSSVSESIGVMVKSSRANHLTDELLKLLEAQKDNAPGDDSGEG